MSRTPPPRSVEVRNKMFVVNRKPFFMFSGEIHYFRMPESVWERHVEQARKAGLNTVSTYIPWRWHEDEEGKFDFDGSTHPQRNLRRFMQIVADAGLYLSVRVGPVCNAEVIGEGIPIWLLEKHPDVFAKNSCVPPYPDVTLLSYMSPRFLDFVGKWYAQVLPVLKPLQITECGHILMMQLCNEIAMVHWLAKGSDASEHVCRMYADFLRGKYKNIESLNEAYQSKHARFEDVCQPEGEASAERIQVFLDWALFYRHYYATYFHRLAELTRSQGIRIPLSANAPQFYDYDVRGRGVYSPMTTSMFRDFSRLSPGTIFGGAYQMRRLDFENFHDVAITTECTRILDAEAPTIVAELQTGIMRDRPRLYPSDVDLNIKTSAAHGLNGLNCYMFSSGRNTPGIGLFGTKHDWQAPVTLEGEPREHFAAIHEWGAFLKKHGSALAATRKVTDTTLGFYLPYYATEYFKGAWTAELERRRTQWFYDGFARFLQMAGYHFSICDLLDASPESLESHQSLCVFSLEFMDEKTQRKLADYVLNGGKLLVGPRLPEFDLKGGRCAILAEALQIKTDMERGMAMWGNDEFQVDQPIQTFTARHATILNKTTNGASCAILGSTPKGGQWLAYGFGSAHVFDYHVEMVRQWMERLGVERAVDMDPWDVHAVLRWGGDHGFLFLMNYHDVPKKGQWTIRLPSQISRAEPLAKYFSLDRRASHVVVLERSGSHLHEVKGTRTSTVLA